MQLVAYDTMPAELPSNMGRWTSRIALFSLGLLITAAFLHRLFGMPTPVAFNLVVAAYAGIALSLLVALAAAIGIWRHGGPGTARVVFSVAVGLLMLSGPLMMAALTSEHPRINDVTTDVRSPPEFGTLARVRGGPGANSAAYPGERFAAEQARAYPDLKPLYLDRSSEEAFELVVDAVKHLKMDIVREEVPGGEPGEMGVIEAVDRTLIAGFYDDVAIRVAGDDNGARIDIRSASRYGWTDLGRNAERIRTLMREIVARLDATVPTADADRASRAKHLKGEPEDDPKSASRRKSRDRAGSDAQHEPEQKARPPSKDDRRSRDRRPGQSFE